MPGLDSDLYTAWEIAREHHRHLIRAAAISCALAQARVKRLGRRERFWMLVGDLLISFGTKLKARYTVGNGHTYVSVSR